LDYEYNLLISRGAKRTALINPTARFEILFNTGAEIEVGVLMEWYDMVMEHDSGLVSDNRGIKKLPWGKTFNG